MLPMNTFCVWKQHSTAEGWIDLKQSTQLMSSKVLCSEPRQGRKTDKPIVSTTFESIQCCVCAYYTIRHFCCRILFTVQLSTNYLNIYRAISLRRSLLLSNQHEH